MLTFFTNSAGGIIAVDAAVGGAAETAAGAPLSNKAPPASASKELLLKREPIKCPPSRFIGEE